MDMAKIAVASATSFLLGSVLTAVGFLGGSVIAVAFAVFVLGVAITIGLDFLDKKYGISVKIIALLKKQWRYTLEPLKQTFNIFLMGWGK